MSALLFLADENLNEKLVVALFRRAPGVDLVRVRDAGRVGIPDPELLAWAADEDRVLLTHDAKTVPRAAYARVAEGLPMPGVLIVPDDGPARALLDDLTLIAIAGATGDWRDRVAFLPLQP